MSDVAAQSEGKTPASAGAGSRALRNSAFITVARIIGRLLALVTVVTIGNVLGDTAFGEMQTAITYSLIISVVADLGFSTLYVREGARRPDQISRFLNNMLSVRIPLLVAAALLLAAGLWLIGLRYLFIPTIALLVISGYQLMLRNTLYALQRLTPEIIEIAPEAILLLGIVIIGAFQHRGAGFFIWAYTLSYVAAAIYFAIVLIKFGIWKPRWQFELSLITPWLGSALPLAITYIFTTVYWKVDVPILQHFRPYSEVGWYTLAYKPFESLLFLPMTLRTVIFPVLSVYHSEKSNRLGLGTEKFFKALLALGLPITVGIALLANQYTDLLHLFPQCAPALQILGIAVVFLFVDNTFAATLLAMDRQKVFAWIAISGLVINVVLNLFLIPAYGYIGASWAVVLTEIGLVVVGWATLWRLGIAIPVPKLAWRIVISAAVMGGVVWLLQPHGAVMTVGVTVIAGLVYLALLWLLGGADEEDRALVRRALHR